jgi:hypothetical protein
MSSRTNVRFLRRQLMVSLVALISLSQVTGVLAGTFFVNNVGGILIRADGVVRNPTPAQQIELARLMREEFIPPAGAITNPVEIRKISLKAIESACQAALADQGGQLPDEVRYLGGLQRVQYILVYPEQNDVVLAGPAEGWKINEFGDVVGVTTGRPVLQLDDLIVAMRSVETARQEGISCSIDPTQEGYRNLKVLLDRQKQSRQTVNVPVLEQAMKQAFGPQQVKLQGLPPTSHMARILVAADYRMKRLAMNLDRSPVPGLPSFVEMIKSSTGQIENVNPRWWLACNYEPMVRSEDGLAWELRGPGVKCMTEDEIVDESGQVSGTGRSGAVARKWANLMTEKYDQLAAKDTVFGELRNVMDLCVIAAAIDQHGLAAKAGCSLPILTGSDNSLKLGKWYPPKQVPPECSFLRTRNGWVVTASGGVQVGSFQVATQVSIDDSVLEVRSTAANPQADGWWWN